MSLVRTIRHARQAGLKKFWRDLNYIGDAKAGTLVGIDAMGNKYYEDLNEIPGRHRWVDYARDDFNTAQLEPVWHSWLHHIRTLPPNKDPVVEASHKSWELRSKNNVNGARNSIDLVSAPVTLIYVTEPNFDSVTGTRAMFRTYDTVRQKINAWEPTVAQRK